MKKILLLIGFGLIAFSVFGQTIIRDYGYFRSELYLRDTTLRAFVLEHSEDSLEVVAQIAAYAAGDTTGTKDSVYKSLQADYYIFDTTPSGIPDMKGVKFWDTNAHTLTIYLENNVKMQVGQEMPFYVKNQSGTLIHNGDPVW